jgi:uncharacterized protein involved in exopolysaccharide biosynthesis
MDQEYNLIDIMKLLWSNVRRIAILAIIVGIVIAIITIFLPNYYKATTIFYAASPDLSLPSPINNSNDRVSVYGNDYDIDRLISISQSNELILHLIGKFDLYNHYNIDSTKPESRHKIHEKLFSLYDVMKTKYGAISLSMEDKDPEIAAAIANEAREKIGETAQTLIKDAQIKTLESYANNILGKASSLALLNDSLRTEKEKYGIIDLTSQAEVLAINNTDVNLSLNDKKGMLSAMKELNVKADSINLVRAKISGLEKKKREIDNQLKNFNLGAATVRTLESQIGILNGQLGMLQERYNQLKASYISPFTTLHVVEVASIPAIKSRPRRSLLVIGACLLTAMLMALLIILQHTFSDNKEA